MAQLHSSHLPQPRVDLKLPGVDVVGGYSITSPPHQLTERGTFNLAIQYSDHAPTLWMSTKCKVGDKLSVQVGGDFWYDPPSPWEVSDLLLIGGGVGINPLFSILQHHVWVLQSPEGPGSPGSNLGAVRLLYSSKTASELLFKVGYSSDVNYIVLRAYVTDCIPCAVFVFMQQQIDRICADYSRISAQYFVTKEKCNNKSAVACESDCLSPLELTNLCNPNPRPPLPSL